MNLLKILRKEKRDLERRAEAIGKAIRAIDGSQTNGRHRMSAAARRRISRAQKKRWAAARKSVK
jgi:hypothetical protein